MRRKRALNNERNLTKDGKLAGAGSFL